MIMWMENILSVFCDKNAIFKLTRLSVDVPLVASVVY